MQSLRRLRLPAAAFAVLLVAVPALAQTPMPDPLDAHDAKRLDRMEKVVRELRSIVYQMRDTGKPVVVEPADTDARLADLTTKIDDLETALTKLNGSLDTTTHELDLARHRDEDLQAQVKALSDRLTAVEQKEAQAAAPTPAAAPTADAAPAEPPKVSAADAFAHARKLMLDGDYDNAEAAFADYVKTYPDSPKTLEAQYWWGKTLSVKGRHAEAANAYIAAIRPWPKTAWAPDAVVELSRSLVELKKPEQACQVLGELHRRYPKAPAAVEGRAAGVRKQAKCA